MSVHREAAAPAERPPVLSICIPTYRMAPYLADLLDGIADQVCALPLERRGLVEVVVSDNASPDDTPAVVELYRARLPRLVYHRQLENIGADRNYLAAVAYASGRFCWLMGSDDVVEAGGVARLIELVLEHDDVAGISIDRHVRSFDLATITPEQALGDFPKQTMLTGSNTVFERMGWWFGYLSAQVIRRDLWDEVVRTKPVQDYYNAYVHVYVIAEMLKICPNWLVVPERLVGWRAENDSFLSSGRYARLKLDVVGFEQITRGTFGENSRTFRAMRDTIATRHLRLNVMVARAGDDWGREIRRKTRRLAFRHYWRSPPFWLRTVPLLLAPDFLVLPLRRLRRRWRGLPN